MKTFAVVALLLALAVSAEAQCPVGSGQWGPNCTDCACSFGAPCDDGPTGTGCQCPANTVGATCGSCFPNWSPEFDCQVPINPCISCPTNNPDECVAAIRCPNHAGCYNNGNVGNKQCKCYRGYDKKPVYGRPGQPFGTCLDINECKRYKNACPVQATCVNKIGSYNCTCRAGLVPIRSSLGIPRFCIKPRRARELMHLDGKMPHHIEVSGPEGDAF